MTILFISGLALAHAAEPYQKSDLSIETHVEDLLGRMTLEEKIGQVRGGIAKSVDDAVKMVGRIIADSWFSAKSAREGEPRRRR